MNITWKNSWWMYVMSFFEYSKSVLILDNYMEMNSTFLVINFPSIIVLYVYRLCCIYIYSNMNITGYLIDIWVIENSLSASQYMIQDVRRLRTRYLKFDIQFYIKYLTLIGKKVIDYIKFDTIYFGNFIFLIYLVYILWIFLPKTYFIMKWFNSCIVLIQFIAI